MESDPNRFLEPNGTLIIAQGEPDERLLASIRRAPRPQLVINRELGFVGLSLEFLREAGERLVGLEVVGSFEDDSAVTACTNLLELNLNTSSTRPLDWASLGRLRHLFVYGNRLNPPLGALRTLETLHVHNAEEHDLPIISQLQSLTSLTFTDSKLPTVPDPRVWPNLESLIIGRAPKMKDFTNLSRATGLQLLTIEECRHLTSLDFVRGLRELRELNFSDSGSIDSIGPICELHNLERLYFYGNTNVRDGDLTCLGRLPRLQAVYYQRRRHYFGNPQHFPTAR